mmetsp:Transcript_11716/g.33135  ORF Transcript_11716/g.33135 Transcript_11716/m.33135 type:complete len:269 (-) Transcript_11716:48-854(-)
MALELSKELYKHRMCLCMPLRLSVLLVAVLTLSSSLLYLCGPERFENAFRHFTGGYARASRLGLGAIETTGVVFGVVGIIGTWYAKRTHVVVFNVWQFIRLAAWVFIFLTDVPLVLSCEEWVNNIDLMTQEHGWNPLMYETAMAGHCGPERRAFLTCSIITLLVFMYLVYGTYLYQEFMNRTPKHLLRIPKDLTTGAFYAHPGEQSHLNQAWEGGGGPRGAPPRWPEPTFGSMPPAGDAGPYGNMQPSPCAPVLAPRPPYPGHVGAAG